MNREPSDPGDDTIVSILARHTALSPKHVIFRWVDKKAQVTSTLTYQELWEKSLAVRTMLLSKGIRRGDRVMISYPFGLEFLAGLIGCMMAGVVGCSVYPPNPQRLQKDLVAFHQKVKDAGAKYALTTASFRRLMMISQLVGSRSEVTWLPTDTLRVNRKDLKTGFSLSVSSDDIAFVQYTSGSTGFPKGVIISQRSLVGNTLNCAAVSNATGAKNFTAVSWMPQYHDMGLIGFYFTVISSGVTGVVCSPLDFILQPTLWHDMVIQFRADTTIGPNFSFGLLIKRLLSSANNKSHPKPIEPWSHVQKVICAAEPVDPVVMDQVISVLGVKPDSLFIGYGLAELGLAACFAKYQVINKLVASGDLDGQSKIRIVDEEKNVNAEGVIGEIYINSPNLIASGYWGNAEATRLSFGNILEGEEGEWLATGDIGLTMEGKLFVTGRSKEVIIINGRNFFPVDIERTLENEFPTVIRPGCVVAYQQSDSSIGIAAELRKGFRKDDCPGVFEIVRLVAQEHQAPVEYVCLLRDHTIPKTTSGKLKRIEVQKISSEGNWPSKAIVIDWRKATENTLQDEDARYSSDDDEDDIDSFLSAIQFMPETSSVHTPKRRQSYLERNFAQLGVDDSVELSNHVGQTLSSSNQSSTEQSVYYSAAFENNFDFETAEQSAVDISLLLRNSSSASTHKPIIEREIRHRLSLRASISKPGISKETMRDISENDSIPPTLGSLYGTQCPFAKGGMKAYYEQHGTKPYPHGNTIEVGIVRAESVEVNLMHLERRLENGTAKREYELAEHIFANSSFWTQVPGYSPHQFALAQDNLVHRDYYPWLTSNFTNLPTLELLRSDAEQFISDKHEAFSIEDVKQFVLLTFFKLFAHQYLTESEIHNFKTFQGQVFDMVMRPHEEPSDDDILNQKAQFMADFMERLKLNEPQASALLDLLIFASMNLVTAIHVCLALLYCENDRFDPKSYAINEDTVLCFVWECLRLFPPQTSVGWREHNIRHVAVIGMANIDVNVWGEDACEFRPSRCSSEDYSTRSCMFAEQAGSYRCPAKDFGLNTVCALILEINESGSWICPSKVKSYASLPYFDPFTLKRLPRVVVIGSGIAGLICSLKLAQKGVKVTLIEKNEEIGGHARYGTVFGSHLRNPAFGAFVPGMYPNFMKVIEELKVDKVFLCQAKEFRQNLAFDGHCIQDPDPVEVARFLRDMKSVYDTKGGSSQTIGMYLESQGYDEHFVIHFFIGKAIHFFAGLTIQEYLDIPLNLIAWFMVADMVEGPEASVYRLRNKEYMCALTCALQSHGVEVLTGIKAARLVARDVTGVRVNVGDNKLVIAEKLVLAVPPSGAVDFLGYHMNDHEKLLTKFICPQETVVLHQDLKWTAGNDVGVLFGLLPDAGNPLPSRQDTIPLTTTTVSDSDGTTVILSTHAYANYSLLPIEGPKEYFSFTHTRITLESEMFRSVILDNQGRNNTYYAGGWTEGFMLHEDAIVSGLRVAKDILSPLGCEAIQIIPRDVALIGRTDEAKRMISSIKPSRHASSKRDTARRELRSVEVPKNASIELIIFELSNEIGRQVMPDETISSLGMTSLNISAVHSRMKEVFDLSDDELPISVFFMGENPVSSLASFMQVKNTIYDHYSMSQRLKMADVDETIPVEPSPETEQFGSLLIKTECLSSQKKDALVHSGGQNVHVVSFAARIAAILFQSLAVLCQPLFLAIIIYPSVLFSKLLFESIHFYLALILMPLSILIHAISGGLILVIIKWILVGRQEEGTTRVWSGKFARRWIVRQCAELLWKYTCWRFWGNTEAMNILYRNLGCNVGKSVSVEPGCMVDYDLVTIGEGTILGKGVIIETEKVSLGVQTLSPVVIGNDCVVEFESQIERGSTLEDKVYLRPRTVIAPFSILQSCTNWHGTTAELFYFNDVETGLDETNQTLSGIEFHNMYHFFRYFILFVLTPYLLTCEYGCLYITCAYIFQRLGFWGLTLLIWLPATVIWLMLVALSIILKRCILGKVQPGVWIFGSSFHKRKFFVDYLIKEHLLFWQTLARNLGSFLPWSCFVERQILRSLGVKIGEFSQVASLNAWTSYDLLAVGNSVLWGGMAEVFPWNDTLGNLKGKEIVIEDRCFLGAYSQLMGNVAMQQGSTIAACSTALQSIQSNETVIGTKVYNTMMEQPTSSEWNFRSREIANAIGSFFHFLNVILLFNFVFFIIQSLPYTRVFDMLEPTFFACLMLGISLGLALPFLALVMVWFAKAVLIGSFSIFEAENGSWSNIPIQAFEHGILSPLLSHIWQAFGGTHLELCFWIGMGANMGSDVYVDKVKMWEADLVTIGNSCCLKHCRFTAHQVSRQSHSFNPVIIGDRCTIGVNAVANGKVAVEDDTELLGGTRPLSGSRMTSGAWYGYPARRIGDVEIIPKPPVPYWSVVIFNPITTIRLSVSFLLWKFGLYGCSRNVLKKTKMEDVHDLPKCLQGIFVDKASQLELRFDNAVWYPNQSHLVIQAGTYMITKIKGDEVWWNFVGYEFAFQGSTCQKATGWVCIASFKIPQSIVSVNLEQNGDQWLLRHSWFKGEPRDNHIFSRLSDDTETQDSSKLVPGWSWPSLDSTLDIAHEYVPIGDRDIEMHCVLVGNGDETPVLLLHGFPEVSYSWAVHFKQLTKSGRRRLIVPDLRGFGETHSLKKIEEWTVSRAAEDLVELLEYYHIERVIIIAHDYGAITGWALQKLYPEKVAGFVSIGFADIALNQIGGAPDYPGQPPCERVIQKRSRGENPPVSYVADFAQIAKTNLQLVSKDALIGLYQMENSSILSMKNTIKDEKLLPDDLLKVLDRCSKVNPIHVQLIVHKNSDNSYLELEQVLNDDTVYSDLPVVIITCGKDKVWTPELVKDAFVHRRYPNVVIHNEEIFHHYCLNQELAKDRLGKFLAEWLDLITD